MIPLRALLISFSAAVLIIVMAQAHALDPVIVCSDVRNAVATVQQSASVSREKAAHIVEAMARAQGVSDEAIRRARACLK